MDVATFQKTFPEFTDTNPTLIEQVLGRATRAVSALVWGTQVDDGIGLWAAHRLKQMSFGTSTAAAKSEGGEDEWDRTEYGREFKTLRDGICGGFAGGGTWGPCGGGP